MCLLMVAAFIPAVSASTNAELYQIYQNNMLFRQNAVSSVAGTAAPGSRIEIVFSDANADAVTAEGITGSDGRFAVDFTAPEGSFNEYTLTVSQDGVTFAELTGILFGELWLATGQSNMQYDLNDSAMKANGQKGDKNLRILFVEPISYYKNSYDLAPGTPQEENYNCRWFCADESIVYGCSAVGYYFGAKLAQKLDVPVGILSCSLGGSQLTSWLSRESIEGNAFVKSELTKSGEYIALNKWNESEMSQIANMTANYNAKIYPLRHLGVSGFIWYQGESDVFSNHSTKLYGEMFTLMQDEFSANFRYAGGKMPAVFTQLAAYWYGDNTPLFEDYAFYFESMQKEYSDSRALTTIYDVPLDYYDTVGSIHPMTKQPVGERMAECADRLVYHKADACTAATIKSSEILDGKISVTFVNCGDGLLCEGRKLNGFSICGADGIYVDADAEIVSSDTVEIFSKYVPEPVSASYAYVLDNTLCNLYSSAEGKAFMPVACFITDTDYRDNLFEGMFVANPAEKEIWHTTGGDAGLKTVWSAKKAELTFSEDGMNVTSSAKSIEITSPLGFKEKLKTEYFCDTNRDYSDYSKIILTVTNNGKTDIKGVGVKFNTSAVTFYTAYCDTVIPADGEPHEVEIDITALKFDGNRGGIGYGNDVLGKITEITFIFENAGKADFTISDISFAPDTEGKGLTFPSKTVSNGNIFEFMCSVFTVLLGKLFRVFNITC